MHFSVPDTQELEETGNKFTAFNIHVNGVFHCSVRFKQLHNFHDQLCKEFGADKLPPFPPKKLFSLNATELQERRLHLEKYIQLISQDYRIQNSPLFTGFFLQAQQETQSTPGEDVTLDVFLMNGHKITVNIVSTVVRKLQDFESPYLSLKAANKSTVHRLVLRKSYWDPVMDDDLIDDRVAMNLLYVQAVSDIDRGWVIADAEQHRRLAALQQRNSKKEYLRLARTLKFYGFLQFKAAISDYPETNTRVIIYAGNKQLHFSITDGPSQGKEGVFYVTRMRCWRITATAFLEDKSTTKNSSMSAEVTSDADKRMEISIEYLLSKDNLKWITLQTDQAILLSMCLQGMVDELMMKKTGRRMRRPQDRDKNAPASAFMRRDGTVTGEVESNESVGQMAKESVKRFTEKITALNIMGKPKSQRTSSMNSSTSADRTNATNSAFGGIGDDDL